MKRILTLSLVGLLVLALGIAGCGKKSPSPSSSGAQQILQQSAEKTSKAQSYKLTGSYNVDLGGQAMQVSLELDVKTTVPQPKTANDIEAHGVIRSEGHDIEVFIVGGVMYMNVTTPIESANIQPGWYKQSLQNGTTGSPLSTASDIAALAKVAKGVRIVSRNGNSYTITFNIDPKFLEEQALAQQQVKDLAPEALDIIRNTLSKMKMTITMVIDKSSKLISEAKLKMTIPPVPPTRAITLDMNLKLSNYNKPVTVTLPPEAQNAQQLPEGVSPLPGTGLPGLGL